MCKRDMLSYVHKRLQSERRYFEDLYLPTAKVTEKTMQNLSQT
jgi:hypothetical protein